MLAYAGRFVHLPGIAMDDPKPQKKAGRLHAASLLFGALLLSALLVFASRFGEIERFVDLARRAQPGWLLLAAVVQFGTYVCEACAWRAALAALGVAMPLRALISLSIAKLFSDQAMPSGGVSGSALVVTALRRRGIAAGDGLACLVINLVAHFAAYMAMAIVNALILVGYHDLNRWVLSLTLLLSAVAVAVLLTAVGMRWKGAALARFLSARLPRLVDPLQALVDAPAALLRAPVLAGQFGWQIAEMLLDALSLWLIFRGLGQALGFPAALSSFMTASIVGTLSPIPLGLGSFEASCVAMLRSLGAGFEASVAATMLLRGFTVWLPMLPGLWLIRRALR